MLTIKLHASLKALIESAGATAVSVGSVDLALFCGVFLAHEGPATLGCPVRIPCAVFVFNILQLSHHSLQKIRRQI